MNSKQIIITFIILITLIGTCWYCYHKFKPSTPNSTNEPINTTEENDDSIQKTKSTSTETPKKTESPKPEVESKISISQVKFNEITKFIFSKNDIPLPINLSKKEKIEIEKNKEFYKKVFEIQKKIEKLQNDIDNFNNTLNEFKNIGNELKKQQQTPNVQRKIAEYEKDKAIHTGKLKDMEKSKKMLDEKFKISIKNYKKNVIDNLNKIYQIVN
jgi:hypothetical protein